MQEGKTGGLQVQVQGYTGVQVQGFTCVQVQGYTGVQVHQVYMRTVTWQGRCMGGQVRGCANVKVFIFFVIEIGFMGRCRCRC